MTDPDKHEPFAVKSPDGRCRFVCIDDEEKVWALDMPDDGPTGDWYGVQDLSAIGVDSVEWLAKHGMWLVRLKDTKP